MNRGPVALNILQGWAEAAQQIITNSPISYIRAVMTQGCGGMLLARGKKWWWITWLLTGSSSSVEVRLDEFILGWRKRIIQWPKQDRTGLTGTPLGVGLAIKIFIHEIAFISIWPNQQARWVLESTRKTVRTKDIINECMNASWTKDDAHITMVRFAGLDE